MSTLKVVRNGQSGESQLRIGWQAVGILVTVGLALLGQIVYGVYTGGQLAQSVADVKESVSKVDGKVDALDRKIDQKADALTAGQQQLGVGQAMAEGERKQINQRLGELERRADQKNRGN